jgi:4-hydroxy-tetrahydrodipicolinate synthase
VGTNAVQPGVWGVLATPFTRDGTAVDEESLDREVRWYVERGVTGLTALGVFGEAAQLSAEERRRVVEIVVAARGSLPVVVGVTSLNTAGAVEEIRNFADVAGDGLAAAMVQINSSNPSELVPHLEGINRSTGVSIVLQDYPAISGVRITPADLVMAVEWLSSVVAVKSESSPSPAAMAVLASGLKIPVFGGLGGTCLLDELALGAAGAMTGFSVPEGLVSVVSAYRSGGYEAARAAWLPYLPLVNFEFQQGIALAIRKESLRLRGVLAHAAVRAPARPMPDALRGLLSTHLAATVVDPVGARS